MGSGKPFSRILSPDIIILFSGIIAAIHIGKLPPIVPILQIEFSITLIQAGFLVSLVQFAGMLTGIIVGGCVDGFGLKRSMLTGLALLAVASFFGGWAQTASMLLWLRGIEGVGFLLTTLPATALIRRLVAKESLNQRLAWWSCYMGLGIGLALLTAPWALALVGWRGWWLILAGITLVLALIVWARVPVDDVSARGTKINQLRLRPLIGRLQMTLSHAGPWWVALTFAMYTGQWLAVIGFLPSIYSDAGIEGALLGALTALVAFANAGGNAFAGRLMHSGIDPTCLLYVGFFGMALTAFAAFSNWTTGWPMLSYIAILLFSGVGGFIPAGLFALSVQVAPDKAAVSTTVGWMLQWSALGQFSGPPMAAWIAVTFGGWDKTWIFVLFCSLLGIAFSNRSLNNRRTSVEAT